MIRNGSHGDRNISLCVSYNLVFQHFHRFSQKSIESLILKLCNFSRDPSYREGFTFVYDVLHCIPSFFKCSRDLHKFMEINGKPWNPVEIHGNQSKLTCIKLEPNSLPMERKQMPNARSVTAKARSLPVYCILFSSRLYHAVLLFSLLLSSLPPLFLFLFLFIFLFD